MKEHLAQEGTPEIRPFGTGGWHRLRGAAAEATVTRTSEVGDLGPKDMNGPRGSDYGSSLDTPVSRRNRRCHLWPLWPEPGSSGQTALCRFAG